MSRYDGLIIPRSYSEYINKTDAATLSQALALPGVMDAAPTESSNKAARSGGIYNAIDAIKPVDTVALNNMHSVTSNAVAIAVNTLFNNMLQIISRNSIAGSGDWGALILNDPGAHIYFLVANRISTGDNYIAIINTYGDSSNKTITVSVLENTNNHFILATNAQGTLYLEYFDNENKFTYSYCLFRFI